MPLRYQYRAADIASFFREVFGRRSEVDDEGRDQMTGPEVERDARTAFPLSSVPSTGVAAPMPPQSQGAERRSGHRAGRTGSRWALRALVVGGLAGAAWLLTGAAAHAADHGSTDGGLTLDSSIIGTAVHGGDRHEPVVNRILKAATKPLESDRRGLVSAVPLPNRVAGTLNGTTRSRTDADAAHGGVNGVVRGLTSPIRLAGEAVDTRNLVPITDLPQGRLLNDVAATAVPVKHSAHRVVVSGSEHDAPEADADRSGADRIGVDEVVADEFGGAAVTGEEAPVVEPALDRRSTVGTTVTRQHEIAADRHQAAVTVAEPKMVSDTPGGDAPAPLRGNLGAANGVPASGPGSATDGGSAAFLPAKVADSTVARRRLTIATDVEVRRHDAEAPTVSPD
ncbi:hypothetical protein ACFFRK_06445 [Amorphoplanes digitatis]|uniref:hypothetical protein n=1 Tax=Actinoplanes digitatis TaxID=1868 RepID=UPI0019425EFA|nr:hypothetical protein [Actinoplanes digitatis]